MLRIVPIRWTMNEYLAQFLVNLYNVLIILIRALTQSQALQQMRAIGSINVP